MGTGPTVGLIGVGVMGSAIGHRLLDVSTPLSIFDVNLDSMKPLADRGATISNSSAELTSASDFVVLSLNTDEVVERAVFGKGGVVQGANESKLLIDMSSITPAGTLEMANRLRSETGMGWVDCPLSGGAPAVAEGALTIMAGGSSEDISRSKAVMDLLARNFTHMGASGAGQATKLINQLIVGNGFATLMEAAQLSVEGGIDPELIPRALAGGRADSPILQEFFVKLATRDYRPSGRIDNMLKDLSSAQRFAAQVGVATPLLSANVELHRWLVSAGYGPADTAEMMEFYGSADPGAS